MKKFLLGSSVNMGLLVLRVFSGSFMLFAHGYPKLKSFNERFSTFSDPLGVGSEISYLFAVGAEFLCSILVILGLFTRVAVIPLIITMLVAALIVHADDPWSKQEFALLYAVTFTTLFFTGAGKFSMDHQVLK
ncbi:MAG: DoxX family protein [Bacteroidia bacterium]